MRAGTIRLEKDGKHCAARSLNFDPTVPQLPEPILLPIKKC